MSPTIHATAVALRQKGAWHGVLIRGASGAGKSDLALRLIERGARLVSDDRVHVWASDGRLYARAPERIAGLIEVRGLGIACAPTLEITALTLVIDLIDHPPERLPEPQFETLEGIALPLLQIDPRPASASTVVARAIEAL